MIYLFTRADGKQTEGIGAVAQCQIHTYTLSKMLGVGFASTKFENLQHYQEYDTQENFSNDVTNFFNFPNQIEPPSDAVKFEHVDQTFLDFIEKNRNGDDIYVEISNKDLIRVAISNTEKWSSVIPDLSKLVSIDDSKKYFDEDKLNISLHITNFIEGRDNDRTPQREQFEQGNRKEKYYIDLLKNLMTFSIEGGEHYLLIRNITFIPDHKLLET